MKRTKAEAERTRETILTAAIEVFLDRGVSGASLDQIARAAGVTRGAIYWHFRDKQEVFAALERRANVPNEELGMRLSARLAADPGLDPLNELKTTIRAGLQDFEAHPDRPRILTILLLRCEYSDGMRSVIERQRQSDLALQKLFATVLGLAEARGSLTSGWSANLAAQALLLLINGSVLEWIRAQRTYGLADATVPLAAAFLDTIGGAAARVGAKANEPKPVP